jgi:NADH-quinone oxidoreductase subunit N
MGSMLAQAFESPSIDWWALVPQMILLGAALKLLLVTSLSPRSIPNWVGTATTVAAGIASFVVAIGLWYDVRDNGPRSTIADAFGVDGFSLFFTVLVAVALVATALLAHSYIEREGLAGPEFHALLMAASAGAIVMASANDLIVLFLGLESLSIALYVLIAMHARRPEARESAMKYFVLGAFSSAFLLYGIALVYGATGSTNLVHVRTYLDGHVFRDEHLILTGMALLMVGLAFKVAAAPFHFWAPDVYQGAPSPVTGYMASVAKAAGFAALLRVFFAAFASYEVEWTPIVTGLAILTLLVGSVMAILQDDVKRMLAFSSISHAGYVLVAVQAASDQGTAAALFYLFTYTLMVIGSFGIVGLMGWDEGHGLARYAGLAKSRPTLALAFTVFLLAQAGVPLTSGFVGKFQVISASVDARNYVLAGVAMLTAVVSAFMYLRIVMAMYVAEDDAEGPGVAIPWTSGLVVLAAFAFTIVVGIVPQFLIEFSRDAIPVLIAG